MDETKLLIHLAAYVALSDAEIFDRLATVLDWNEDELAALRDKIRKAIIKAEPDLIHNYKDAE